MYIKIINSLNILNKKHVYILISVLIVITAYIAYVVKDSSVPNKESKAGLLFDGKKPVNITSYYINSNITVNSNKNSDTYIIEEWYKENVGQLFKIKDAVGSTVKYLLKNKHLTVYNEKQKNILEILEYNNQELNILSFNTFVKIYNENILNKRNDIKVINNKNNTIIYVVYNKNIYISSLELRINRKVGKIIDCTIRDIHGKDKIIITYNKVEINKIISDDIFIK